MRKRWVQQKLSKIKKQNSIGAPGWLSQLSVWLGFGAGHDLFREFKPHVGLCTHRIEPAWDSPSLPLCLYSSPAHIVSVSLKINKHKESSIGKVEMWVIFTLKKTVLWSKSKENVHYKALD